MGDVIRAYRLEATVQDDRPLTLQHLSFRAGERVEVIVLEQASKSQDSARYPLRGISVEYLDPTAPVAEDDWEARDDRS